MTKFVNPYDHRDFINVKNVLLMFLVMFFEYFCLERRPKLVGGLVSAIIGGTFMAIDLTMFTLPYPPSAHPLTNLVALSHYWVPHIKIISSGLISTFDLVGLEHWMASCLILNSLKSIFQFGIFHSVIKYYNLSFNHVEQVL